VSRKLLDFEILYLLSHASHTGYSIRKALLSEFGSKVSFGTLYPHLEVLQSIGLVARVERGTLSKNFSEFLLPQTGRGRKLFVLTPMGAKVYETIEEDLFQIAQLVMRNSPRRKVSAQIVAEDKAQKIL
jgi:DNA-binding PadR family transcriptional regulator